MTDFEFNCMTFTNRLMDHANKQHYLAVKEAKQRQDARATARDEWNRRCAKNLDALLTTVVVVGIAVATCFMIAIGAK